MIEITNLCKYYGEKVAIDDVSFSINKGETVGFLGANGAGKSTMMNIITGYLSATSGSVIIDGYHIAEHPVKAKKKIGYLPEYPPLYMNMTVEEYLKFSFRLKKIKGDMKKELNKIIENVKIEDVFKRKIKNLSKGYCQRLGMAQALVGDPEILILDEPTAGLDPMQIAEMRELIKKLGGTCTILLSSHLLQEISAVCDKVIIINKGKIIATDTPENLSRSISSKALYVLRIEGIIENVLTVLKRIPGVSTAKFKERYDAEKNDYIIEASEDIGKVLFYKLAEEKCPITMMQPISLSLEDVFLKLTSEEGRVNKNASNILS